MSISSQKSLSNRADMESLPLDSLEQLGEALVKVVSGFMKRELAPHGLTKLDFTLLRLFLTGEEWSVSELAMALKVDAPSVSRTVSKLVDNCAVILDKM